MFTESMNFALGDDIEALRDMVHRWAQERVAPMAAEIDASNEFPSELWREMGELGLLGVTVPEEFGGAGLGYLAHTIVVERIGAGVGFGEPVIRGAFKPVCEPD